MKTHLIDYPPRGTACGLYYPKKLLKGRFGAYFEGEVTCKRCLKCIASRKSGEAKRLKEGI